ncbi:hypothetical protein JXJ21_02360 [candidate division KSB1 bacterium]|nr:hypothetical protein [candidate division KSB1 bacterium]
MINQYKRLDVFSCNYQSHARFENKVSVYHVLKARNCYPHGCIYFKWKCKLFNKGKRCIKGFNYVGKKCVNCSYYTDIKIHSQPKINLDPAAYQQFTEELQLFEDWLFDIENHTINFMGTIDVVKPRLQKEIQGNEHSLKLVGFTLIFREAYFDLMHYEDLCYVNISPAMQQKVRFAEGDEIEFQAIVQLDRGRIILNRLRNIEFITRSDNRIWTVSDALVVKQTATVFAQQLPGCLSCAHGVLVDVADFSGRKPAKKRELYCLKGTKDPDVCIHLLPVEILDNERTCP